jgi:hypothetical protein
MMERSLEYMTIPVLQRSCSDHRRKEVYSTLIRTSKLQYALGDWMRAFYLSAGLTVSWLSAS